MNILIYRYEFKPSHFMLNQRNAFQNITPCQTENGSQSAMKTKECRKVSENVTKRCRMEEKHKKNYEDVFFFLSFFFFFYTQNSKDPSSLIITLLGKNLLATTVIYCIVLHSLSLCHFFYYVY